MIALGLLIFAFLSSYWCQCVCCCRYLIATNGIIEVKFGQLSIYEENALSKDLQFDSSRPVYISKPQVDLSLLLYHTHDSKLGVGRWVIGTVSSGMNSTSSSVVAFTNSWAVAPQLTRLGLLPDSDIDASWQVLSGSIFSPSRLEDAVQNIDSFSRTDAFEMTCAADKSRDSDGVIFLDTGGSAQPQLSGFYIRKDVAHAEQTVGVVTGVDGAATTEPLAAARAASTEAAVYVKVKEYSDDPHTYLFALPTTIECSAAEETENSNDGYERKACTHTTNWLVGDRYGVDAGLAFAVVVEGVTAIEADVPAALSTIAPRLPVAGSVVWRVVAAQQPGHPWVEDTKVALLVPTASEDIYQVLRRTRSLRTPLPGGKQCICIVLYARCIFCTSVWSGSLFSWLVNALH